jgi:hypothetical protein
MDRTAVHGERVRSVGVERDAMLAVRFGIVVHGLDSPDSVGAYRAAVLTPYPRQTARLHSEHHIGKRDIPHPCDYAPGSAGHHAKPAAVKVVVDSYPGTGRYRVH